MVVGATKGGTGKTSTAVALAALLARRDGSTVLVDADEVTAGASTWWHEAEADGWVWPDGLSMVRWRSPMTLPLLGHVVIDTGPGDPRRLAEALEFADTAVIPVRAERADVGQVGKSASLVEKAATEAPLTWGVLLTHVVLRSREASEAREGVTAAGFPLLDTVIPFRRDYARMSDTVPEYFGAYTDLLTELEA